MGETADDGFPRLRTARLTLCVPTLDDSPALLDYAVRNFEHHARWSPPAPPNALSLPATIARVHSIRSDCEAGRGVRFWFRLNAAPNGFVGAASLSGITLGAFRGCTLGYHLDVAHQGVGLMHEALQAVVRYAFDDVQLHRLQASYMPDNARSARVLERLGFQIEGYAKRYLFINGQFRDHVLTSLINDALPDAEQLCTPVV